MGRGLMALSHCWTRFSNELEEIRSSKLLLSGLAGGAAERESRTPCTRSKWLRLLGPLGGPFRGF